MKETRVSLNKIDGQWISSYTGEDGVKHYIASGYTKNELILSMARIIMRGDANCVETEQ